MNGAGGLNYTPVKLSVEVAKLRAVEALASAVRQLESCNIIDALRSYGTAQAYKTIYDDAQRNPDINSLYRDCREFKRLSQRWAVLFRNMNILSQVAVVSGPMFTDHGDY